jgi:hypothetical protein
MYQLTKILLLLSGITANIHCRQAAIDTPAPIKQLYSIYQNGEISVCKYNGELGYSCGLNAYDAGTVVYDKNGKQIGTCNYAFRKVDAMCEKLTDCETVYRVKDNIWKTPAIDKYGLGK